jgi:hypothetical protein
MGAADEAAASPMYLVFVSFAFMLPAFFLVRCMLPAAWSWHGP